MTPTGCSNNSFHYLKYSSIVVALEVIDKIPFHAVLPSNGTFQIPEFPAPYISAEALVADVFA
jgi:hypothetical protein